VQSTTAIKLAAAWLATILLSPLPAWGAANSFDLFLNRIAAFTPINRDDLRQNCKPDRLCAAQRIATQKGPAARLEPVRHPDSDSIRRARNIESIPSFRPVDAAKHLIKITRFGRNVIDDIYFKIKEFRNFSNLIIDLRHNTGGDFDRMIRTAALFTGAIPDAAHLTLLDPQRSTPVDIPAPAQKLNIPRLTVLIGGRTASSAEVLAALLRRYAGATILGERSVGKDFLYRIIPVTHDWRLLLPAETISIPGARLKGGVTPDGPIPPDLKNRIE
jgi:C-terminal processing protease CtpA/Prc